MKNLVSSGKIIAILHRLGQRFVSAGTIDLDIGPGQVPILIELYTTDGLSQDQIAQRAGIDKTTIARTIKSLDQKGFIRRIPKPGDSRAYSVILTKQGKDARKKILQVCQSWIRIMECDMNTEETALFHNLLLKAMTSASSELVKENTK